MTLIVTNSRAGNYTIAFTIPIFFSFIQGQNKSVFTVYVISNLNLLLGSIFVKVYEVFLT